MEAGLLQQRVASSGDFYIGAQLLRVQHSNRSHTGQIFFKIFQMTICIDKVLILSILDRVLEEAK